MSHPAPERLQDDPALQPVNMEFYRNSFVTGVNNADRLRMTYYFRPADGRLLADLWFGDQAAGPPGFVHGGAMAAVLDEAMGVMAWLNKRTVVTGNINVDFRDLLPLRRHALVEAWVERTEGRKVYTRGHIVSAERSHCESSGLFLQLPLERFGSQPQALIDHYGL